MNRLRSNCVIACLIAMLVLVAGMVPSLSAQETVQNGTLFGTISDSTGAAIAGAAVEATSPALQGSKVATSDDNGAYRISDLPAGIYRISYSKDGFERDVRTDFSLTAGFAARVDVALKIGSVQQTVEVSGTAPVIDTSTTVTSATLTRSTLDEVPTTRSIFQAVYMAPGIRPSATPDIGGNQLGQQQSVGGYGFGGNMVPLVDGMNVLQSNSLTGGDSPGDFVDFDSLEELKVISTGADADMGPPGTVMITVMKSGGNEFHGDARGMGEWNGFQRTNLPSTFTGGSKANQLEDFWDVFGDVGGRIIRDRLWFYGGIHLQRRSTAVIGFVDSTGAQAFDPIHQDNQEAKLTFQATKSLKFVGSFSDGTKIEPQRGGSNLIPLSSTYVFFDHFWTSKGELVWTPSAKWLVDLVGGNYWQPYGYPNQPGTMVAGNPWTINNGTKVVQGPMINTGSSDLGSHNRLQLAGSAGYFPSGKHSFQFGYLAFIPQRETKLFVAHPSGDYQLLVTGTPAAPVPSQITTFNFPSTAVGKEKALGIYAKDTWRVSNRLTLNPGVRFDRYHGFHDAETEPGGPFYAAATFPYKSDYQWWRIVPRIGAAFDLAGNGKTVIRASYGMYNLDALGQFDIDNYNPAAIIQNVYKWTGPCVVTSFTNCDAAASTLANLGNSAFGTTYSSTSGGSLGIVNPDLKMPYFHTATATFEREIGPGFAVRALYVYNREEDIYDQTTPNRPLSAYNVAIPMLYPAADTARAGQTAALFTYNPALFGCPVSNPACSFNQTELVNRTGNPDYYHTFELTATKRKSHKWSALATVDITKNHRSLNATPIFAAYQSTANPVTPNQAYAGTLPAGSFALDQTWDYAVKSYFTYDLPFGINLGLNYQYLAGAPNYRTDQFATGSPLNTVTIPVEKFGTERNPNISLLNIRVAKMVKFGESKSLEGTLELFNALNSSPATTVNYLSGTGASTFGTVSAVLPPMIGRLGLQFRF